MNHAPMVVAEHPGGAARHGGNATVPTCANPPRLPVAKDPEHGGGRGLGGAPSLGRPPERRPLFGGVHVRVPIWLGAPRAGWRRD